MAKLVQQVKPAPAAEPKQEQSPDLAALVNYVRDGRCVLFVGAGLSRAAGFPDWKGLMDAVVRPAVAQAGEAAWRPEDKKSATAAARTELNKLMKAGKYPEVADYCRGALGKTRFYDLVREQLNAPADIPDAHRWIVKTPFACIVTTNFDTLLEDAYGRWSGRGMPKAPTGRELAQQGTLLSDGAFFILKAHGDVDDPGSMVFTAEDYRRITHSNPAFQSILSGILLSHAVLFVGYSLNDPNFRILLDGQLTTFGEEVPSRYALMSGVGKIERDILWRTARIRVFAYEEGRYEKVPEFLKNLSEEVSRRVQRAEGEGARVARAVSAHSAQGARETLGRPKALESALLSIRARGERLDLAWTPRVATVSPDGAAAGAATLWEGSGRLPEWRELYAELRDAHSSGGGRNSTTMANIYRVGSLLMREFPKRLLDELDALPEDLPVCLDLSPEVEVLPWEWIVVRGTPLSLLQPVARRPVGVSDKARGFPFVGKPLRALLIGDPMSNLSGSRKEVEEIAKVILDRDGSNVVKQLIGKEADYEGVLREVETGDYDILHFAGDAWCDERESFLELNDGRVWASELVSLLNRRPPALMMFNSHYTSFVLPGRENDPSGPYSSSPAGSRAARPARGFTRLASRCGVGAFIGCVASPLDNSAAYLAGELYQALMNGLPVATALHRARVSTIDASGKDMTGMQFILSGYPQLVLTEERRTR